MRKCAQVCLKHICNINSCYKSHNWFYSFISTPTDLSPTWAFYRRSWSVLLLSDSVHTSSRSNFCPVVSPRTELVTLPRPPSSPCTTRLYVVSTPVTCVRLFSLILAPHLIRSTIRHFFASLVTVLESKVQHLTGVSRACLDQLRWWSIIVTS